MAKDTFYFSHDYNARSDEKIKKLIMKHGLLGYGLFWAIVEDLYQNANALQLDYDLLAFEYRTQCDVVKSVINDFDLFIIDGDKFSSKSVESRLLERDARSQKARQAAISRWEQSERNASALQVHQSSNAIKENKGKENKGKESKKNEKNNPNISLSKAKDISVPSRDSESDKFDTLNSTKPKLERTKGEALFDIPVQKKEKVSQDKYLALATKLSEIIQTKKNIKHTKSQIQSWSKEFARLEQENGIQYQRQKAAMRWYEEHIGDPYTPVIESGTSFRNKFIKLEAAIVRSENSYTQKTKNNSSLAHFDPEYNDILMRKAEKVKVTVL